MKIQNLLKTKEDTSIAKAGQGNSALHEGDIFLLDFKNCIAIFNSKDM